jgi:hypothetical protein
MRYLVILDQRSPVGRAHSGANNDGVLPDGDLRHPILDCVEVTPDSAYYLFVRRDMTRFARAAQPIHIPHSAIAAIYPYGVDEDPPFGFVPPTSTVAKAKK